MKTSYLIIAIIVGVILGILFMRSCQKPPDIPDNSERITELTRNIRELELKNTALTAERDSLLQIPPKIDKQIIYRDREIDENIASGASTPIGEYRRSLQDNNDLPDSTEELSPREITLGAKYIARVPKLELKAKGYEGIVLKDNEIISNLKFQIKGHKDLRKLDSLTIAHKDQQLARINSFWYDRFVISVGAGGGYTGTAIYPFVGITVGIKIWGSK
jgi:hypothetical protein